MHRGHHAVHGSPGYASVLGGNHHHRDSSYAASLGLIVANYDARLFSGDYQGVVPGVRWTGGRVGLAVTLPAYHLERNGKGVDGVGDLLLHGHVSFAHRGPWNVGAMMMLSAPTGDADLGLGMGHVMLMPELWGGWTGRRVALSGALGYSRALGGGTAHAEHGGGMWPLVEPMNASEATYSAGSTLALAHELGAAVRIFGAIPVGDGDARSSGGLGVVWIAGATHTTFEIQKGLLGDPFGLRGIVETSVRFK